MLNKILVAIDNTDLGHHVFEEALSLAKATSANLILLHVFNPFDDNNLNSIYMEPYGVSLSLHSQALSQYMGLWDRYEKEGLEFLQLFCDRATQAGVKTEFTQNMGDPGRIICDMARNWGAELIVLGRRGRTGLNELFLGSVSNYVLHHAPCSVLTIQGPSHAATESEQAKETASA